MSVLALVTKPEEVAQVVTWASHFARAYDTSLTVLCWIYSATAGKPATGDEEETSEELVADVQRFLSQASEGEQPEYSGLLAAKIDVRSVLHPNATAAALEQMRVKRPEYLVAAATDQSGRTGATYATNPLLRHSPCNTAILFGGTVPSGEACRVFAGAIDGPHDKIAFSTAARMAKNCESPVTMTWLEVDVGEQAIEVGWRELRQLLRDVGVKRSDDVARRVFSSEDIAEFAELMDQHELVLMGANNQTLVRQFVGVTKDATVAVIKRSPPIRRWRRGEGDGKWKPRLSPADYADLIQTLRRGSRLSIDFLVMLGLAAAIAALGLLQDSAAVVIGSMLLAPLMTPMIGTGLALAQANPKLGRNAMLSVFCGFLLTLAVSYIVAIVTPGEEMTSQVLARGSPNLLDLLIAVFSAAAAAYALARPNLVGAVAGVAIATALVPPLCSLGISLAYREIMNAQGAALLFVTNLVAIVLGAALTFRLMGITSVGADVRQRRWVYRTVAVLGIIVIVLAFPLERALRRNIEQGKPQPSNYPLPASVEDALVEHVEKTPYVEIIATGRPSSLHDQSDVVIVLTSPKLLPIAFAEELKQIVRREMEDEELVIEVHCVKEGWLDPEQ